MHPVTRAALHLFLLAHLFMMSVSMANKTPYEEAFGFLTERYQWTFGLHQNWSMFAPNPRLSSAWMDVVGIREDGTRVPFPLPHGTPEPYGVEWTYDRSGKLERNAIGGHRKKVRAAFVRWACRLNDDGDTRFAKVEVASFSQKTVPPGMRAATPREAMPIHRTVLETWNCRRP